MPPSKGLAALAVAATALGALSASQADASRLSVMFTNEQASDEFFFTPLVTTLHNGMFDPFNVGEAASPGIQEIAEEGSPARFIADNPGQNISVIGNPDGFPGAPVIDPGETASLEISVSDKSETRYLSFLSMLIPTNDVFIGNDNPMAYEIFDASGNSTGPLTIQVFGSGLWDAGTEVDNGQGAPFSTIGGMRTDQNGTIQPALASGSLDVFLGTGTPAGTTIGRLPGESDLLATIEVAPVPLPAALPLFAAGLGGLAYFGRRRRKA